MKKIILIGLVLFSFAYSDSCSSERNEHKRALECYKEWLNYGRGICIPSNLYYVRIDSLEQARDWLEKAKLDLEICLADSY